MDAQIERGAPAIHSLFRQTASFPLYCMKAVQRWLKNFFLAARAYNNQGRRVPWSFALFLYNKWLNLHGLQSPGYKPFPGFDHIQGTVFTPKLYRQGERMTCNIGGLCNSEMVCVCVFIYLHYNWPAKL